MVFSDEPFFARGDHGLGMVGAPGTTSRGADASSPALSARGRHSPRREPDLVSRLVYPIVGCYHPATIE